MSPYALGAEVLGVVRVYVGDNGVDDLSIHLPVRAVERKRLREFVKAVGVALGYTMHDSETNPWTCFGYAEGRRDIWIGVGLGLVSIEVSRPE